MTVYQTPPGAPNSPAKKRKFLIPCLIIAVVLMILGGGVLLVCGGGILALVKGTSDPRDATRNFIKGFAEGDNALVQKHNGGFDADTLDTFRTYIGGLGKFEDVNFGSTDIKNNTA